jgi:hypothetical protein
MIEALARARKGDVARAIAALSKVKRRTLSTYNLRTCAQVYNRCQLLDSAESTWIKIIESGQAEPGDNFMLGSVQWRLNLIDKAIISFNEEVKVSSEHRDTYFINSARMKLAYLLGLRARYDEAMAVLGELADDYSELVPEVGRKSKSQMLDELKRLKEV